MIINPYVSRLLDEWKKHRKIIIACDFDDTLRPYKESGKLVPDYSSEIIKIIKKCQHVGAYLVIWTASPISRYEYIMTFCHAKGLRVDSINQNPIQLPYGENGKIYANIYLDDRGGLTEALNILEEALNLYIE